jgi:pilus assembly protein CpaE
MLRNYSRNPLAIVAELPNAPQVLDELNRLRPQAALFLLSGDLTHSFQLVERIRQELPETVVICASEDNSPEVILQSFRSGAFEFLRLPLSEAEITNVFEKLAQRRPPEETHLGKVIAVYASKGGCGTTFVAANLAASLAKLTGKKACVLDLNLQAGDQPLYLGLEPSYSIHDVVRNFDRLDDQLLGNYLTQRSKLLSLLAAPTEIGKDEDIRVEHVTKMILLLSLDIPAIRSAKRALDIFNRLGYDRKRIKVVINRFSRSTEFDLKQVEKVLEARVFATISNDYQAAIASINVGEPLVLSKTQSKIINDFRRMAGSLIGSGSEVTVQGADGPGHGTGAGKTSLWNKFTGIIGPKK